MNREGFLTARDVMNFNFCPRIVYFEHVMRIPQRTTTKELFGRRNHARFARTSKRTKIIPDFPALNKSYEVFLKDEKMNFLTVADCIAVNPQLNEAYPIQVKDAYMPKVLFRTVKYQCIGEAYLVAESLKCGVPYAYVKFLKSNNLLRLKITPERIADFKNQLGEINSIIASEVQPEPTKYRKRCNDCCFLSLCKRV